MISVAAKLAYVSEVGPGPGFFPLWLGIGLVLFAVWIDARILVDLREARLKANPNHGKLPVAPWPAGWR